MEHKSTHEPGYRAVLIREETKVKLKQFRFSLNDPGRAQERRLADAFILVGLDHAELHAEVFARVGELAIVDGRDKPLVRTIAGAEAEV